MAYEKKIENYLADCFGGEVHCNKVPNTAKMPSYLNIYDYYMVQCLNEEFLLMRFKGSEEVSVSTILKHMGHAKKNLPTDKRFVFAFELSSNYFRERLLGEKIPFIVIGKQIYVPFLGAVYTDTIQKKYKVEDENMLKQDSFSSSAEATAIYFISRYNTNNCADEFTQAEISQNIGFTQMSVSRGCNELYKKGWLDRHQNGTQIDWKFIKSYDEIIREIQIDFSNPVLKTIFVEKDSLDKEMFLRLVQSGETELSKYSMLSPPKNDVYAISKKEWNLYKGNAVELPTKETNTVAIELWKYKVPTKNGKIDPLALYLSVKDIFDERVKQAAKKLLKNEVGVL